MNISAPHRCDRGFTLVEAVTVVAVLVVMAACTMPAITRARQQVRTSVCLGNQRQIGMALLQYAANNLGYTPPRFVEGPNGPNWPGPPGYPYNFAAFWSDPWILGQYCGSGTVDFRDPKLMNQYVSRRSPLVCPSDNTHKPVGNTQPSSYGLAPNFTTVQHTYGYDHMWKLSSKTYSDTEMILVDGFDERFSPGGWDPRHFPFYGNLEPLVNNPNYWQLSGVPGSAYNWARRHSNGANVLFLDGHASYFKDLKPAYDAHAITLHMIME